MQKEIYSNRLFQTLSVIFNGVIDVSTDGCHWQWCESMEDVELSPWLLLRSTGSRVSSFGSSVGKEAISLSSQNSFPSLGTFEKFTAPRRLRERRLRTHMGKSTNLCWCRRQAELRFVQALAPLPHFSGVSLSTTINAWLSAKALLFPLHKLLIIKFMSCTYIFQPFPHSYLSLNMTGFWRSIVTCK